MEASKTWIKICGLTKKEDVLQCLSLGVDALGFNFVKSSPRYIKPELAQELTQIVPSHVECVGVFVNEERKTILNIAKHCSLSTIQFHGDESVEDLSGWEEYKIIRALRLSCDDKVDQVKQLIGQRILVDAYSPTVYGGTGKRLSKELLSAAKDAFGQRLIISGGLNPSNVASIVDEFSPYGVDVASGVELSPGQKDPKLVESFVLALRSI